jgi:hypothetical protein
MFRARAKLCPSLAIWLVATKALLVASKEADLKVKAEKA